jgi:hypothetical protein
MTLARIVSSNSHPLPSQETQSPRPSLNTHSTATIRSHDDHCVPRVVPCHTVETHLDGLPPSDVYPPVTTPLHPSSPTQPPPCCYSPHCSPPSAQLAVAPTGRVFVCHHPSPPLPCHTATRHAADPLSCSIPPLDQLPNQPPVLAPLLIRLLHPAAHLAALPAAHPAAHSITQLLIPLLFRLLLIPPPVQLLRPATY